MYILLENGMSNENNIWFIGDINDSRPLYFKMKLPI